MNFCYAQKVQSPGKGYLELDLNISTESVYIVLNDNWDDWKAILIGEPVALPEGRQKVTVIAKGLQDATSYVDIKAGKTIHKNITMVNVNIDGTGSSYQWIRNGVNFSIITDDDSEIFIDGKWIALGSFEVHIPLGKHKIEAVHPSGAKREKEVNINSYRLTKLEMYNKPLEGRAKLLSLVPGGSQLYKKQSMKGYAFLGLTVTGFILAGVYEHSYIQSNEEYEEINNSYRNSSKYTSEEVLLLIAEKAEEQYKIAKNDAKIRDIFFYSAIGIYALNILDALLSTPQAGYRQNFDDTKNSMGIKVNKTVLAINYKITF